jgi:hypothetical protein
MVARPPRASWAIRATCSRAGAVSIPSTPSSSTGRRTSCGCSTPSRWRPSAYRVKAGGRWWYGNCAWDAFGICAALHADGRVETSCPDCGEPLVVELREERPDDGSLLFHCLVPAARWWDDIVFT